MNEDYYNGAYPYHTEPVRVPETPAPKKSKGKTGVKILSVILCGLLFGASAAAAFHGVDALLKSKNAATETVAETA